MAILSAGSAPPSSAGLRRNLARFGVSVNIPLTSGWHGLAPEQAVETANAFRAAGCKRVFSACAE